MPGAFINDFAAPTLHRPLINGEIIDLTEPSLDLPSLITFTSTLIAKSTVNGASIAATYGLQKLNEHNIPSHLSDFILNSTQRVGAKVTEIDWLQVSKDVVNWVQDHPRDAKAAGYVIVGGVVFFKPRILPKLAWEVWKVRESGLGACELII
jgi:hypothetical protein